MGRDDIPLAEVNVPDEHGGESSEHRERLADTVSARPAHFGPGGSTIRLFFAFFNPKPWLLMFYRRIKRAFE